MNIVEKFSLYYGKAALHTFWEAALASLSLQFGGSGLDWMHLPSVSILEKVGTSAGLAGLAAVLTLVKQWIVLAPPGQTGAMETSDVSPASLLAASSVGMTSTSATSGFLSTASFPAVPDTGVTAPAPSPSPRPSPKPKLPPKPTP